MHTQPPKPGFFSKERRTERARRRFPIDSPLRYQHVLKGDRLDEDPTELEPEVIDLSWYRDNPGEVVDIEGEEE